MLMRLSFAMPIVAGVSIVLAACTSDQAYMDAKIVREGAMDFYTEEILGNLIRAANRQFFFAR